jgi:hypothetical protein
MNHVIKTVHDILISPLIGRQRSQSGGMHQRTLVKSIQTTENELLSSSSKRKRLVFCEQNTPLIRHLQRLGFVNVDVGSMETVKHSLLSLVLLTAGNTMNDMNILEVMAHSKRTVIVVCVDDVSDHLVQQVSHCPTMTLIMFRKGFDIEAKLLHLLLTSDYRATVTDFVMNTHLSDAVVVSRLSGCLFL